MQTHDAEPSVAIVGHSSGAPSAPRRSVRWTKLGERARLMLQVVNDCMALSSVDLARMVWRHDRITDRAVLLALQRWQDQRLIQRCADDGGTMVQLGGHGARILREEGFPSVSSSRRFRPATMRMLRIINRFGASLIDEALYDDGVAGIAWRVRPFGDADGAEDGVRSDAFAAILYDCDGLICVRPDRAGYMPELLDRAYVPPPSMQVRRLILELDLGTETIALLRARIQRWQEWWERQRGLFIGQEPPIALWVTTLGFTRIDTIWRLWNEIARFPAWFSTLDTLMIGDSQQHLHPWSPQRLLPHGAVVWVWRDRYGRPRSLRPWDEIELHAQRDYQPETASSSLSEAIMRVDMQRAQLQQSAARRKTPILPESTRSL